MGKNNDKTGHRRKSLNFASAVGINGLQTCCDYAAAKGGVMSEAYATCYLKCVVISVYL